MRLDPLYRMRWAPDTFVGIAFAEGGAEGRYFVTVDSGQLEGRISGTYRGSNNANRRGDGTFESSIHGAIQTHDGETVVFEIAGYSYEVKDGRRAVGWARHWSGGPYRWLNNTLCAMEGEVRDGRLVMDVYEIIWESPPDTLPQGR